METKRVLIVDDDNLICTAFKKKFSSRHVIVLSVENGNDAIAEVNDKPYDLVFLDIHLPDANGFDVLDAIRKISPGTKVIIMSADATDENMRRARTGGALHFIEKPFSLAEIRPLFQSTLFEYTERRRQPRYPCRLPLTISIISPYYNGFFENDKAEGTALDVGINGLKLYTEYLLKERNGVRISAVSGDERFLKFMPTNTTAEVVWLKTSLNGIHAGLRYIK